MNLFSLYNESRNSFLWIKTLTPCVKKETFHRLDLFHSLAEACNVNVYNVVIKLE